MAHTIELRNPFLNHDIIRFALSLPLEWRTNKKILKDTFAPILPDSIIERKKEALKNPEIKKNSLEYRYKVVEDFLSSLDI
jgi:asparagine synthase (glutamine-hydrolysing)